MKKLFVLGSLLLFFTGCEDYLDINQDPDSPVTSTPDLLLPPVQAYTATSIFDHGEELSYIVQHVATFSGFDKYRDRWDYVTANRIGQWRRHYHDISINAKHTMTAARREGATNYEGVANILFAFSSLRTTALFGDMPYLDALKGDPSPAYDPQEVIYQEILKELDYSIELLENTNPDNVRPMTANEDHIFKGDLDKWIRFAHAVKARTLIHLTPNVNTDYDAIIQEVDAALNGWEDVIYDYSAGVQGNQYQMNQWGPLQADPAWDYGNNRLISSAPSRFMLEEALHYDATNHIVGDPRTPYLMTPNDDGEYLSIVPSQGKIASFDDEAYPNLYGSYITQDYGPMYIFREEELHFIKAEALFSKGDAGNAYNSFIAGIRANMARAGVPDAEVNQFLASEFVPQNSSELLLRDIMMQKYVALWLDGEVWTDMRRYNYDNQIYVGLEPPPNKAPYWEDGEWIERFPYDTETEEIYNKPELDRLGAYQNPEWLKVPMYWAN